MDSHTHSVSLESLRVGSSDKHPDVSQVAGAQSTVSRGSSCITTWPPDPQPWPHLGTLTLEIQILGFPQNWCIRNSGDGPLPLFEHALNVVLFMLKFENHCHIFIVENSVFSRYEAKWCLHCRSLKAIKKSNWQGKKEWNISTGMVTELSVFPGDKDFKKKNYH